MAKFLFIILFIISCINMSAQRDSLNLGNDVENSFFTQNIDTLSFKGIESIPKDSLRMAAKLALKNIPDSVYIKRLQSIESPINFPFNSKVKAYIELYTKHRRDLVSAMLGLSKYYFPIFESQLDAAGLPLELKYLPIIESALNPKAFSRTGASGLWQFMYGTGKIYGLKINSYVDDRKDPIKSTAAAVKYLKDLYNTYHNWYLAIAAYNCGPGNVNKAIRRSGGKRDFWQIYYHLPSETRSYVPAFIAAAYTMTYYNEHLISPDKISIPSKTDTVIINNLLHFKQITAITGIDIEQLRELNPQYRLDVIPSISSSYPLRLPVSKVDTFIDNEKKIFSFEREKFFASNKLAKPVYQKYAPATPRNKSRVYYHVKSGDAIGLIADWYNVRTSDLRYWNNIRHNLIRVGQKLVVYVPKSKVSHYKLVDSRSHSQKNKSNGRTTVLASNNSYSNTSHNNKDYVLYKVRRGDNLWSIARKYPGISDSNIMSINGLTSRSKLKPGQTLRIRRKS